MIQKIAPIIIVLLQVISTIWYIFPSNSSVHVPGGFIKMMIFGGITLSLLIITTILFFIYKPSEILWKILFIMSIGMVLLTWFYSK